MMKWMMGFVMLVSLVLHADAFAQPQPPPPPLAARNQSVPLRVQIVLSTHQGEKKISSVPYTLSVNAGREPGLPTQLRMGVKVPVPAMAPPTVDGKRVDGMLMAGPVTYHDIGTNIDCVASVPFDDGHFHLYISIEDKSFANQSSTARPGEPPVIRSFPPEQPGDTPRWTVDTVHSGHRQGQRRGDSRRSDRECRQVSLRGITVESAR